MGAGCSAGGGVVLVPGSSKLRSWGFPTAVPRGAGGGGGGGAGAGSVVCAPAPTLASRSAPITMYRVFLIMKDRESV